MEFSARRLIAILGWVVAAILVILYPGSKYEISFHKKTDGPLTNASTPSESSGKAVTEKKTQMTEPPPSPQRTLSESRKPQLGVESATGGQPLPRANYKLAWGSEPGFETPDPNRIYSRGQKIKVGEPAGVHTGVLEMDAVYFVAVDKMRIQTTSSNDCKFECSTTGTIETHFRPAISPSWKRMNFTYWCNQSPPVPGEIVVALRVRGLESLRIGEYEGHCELTSR